MYLKAVLSVHVLLKSTMYRKREVSISDNRTNQRRGCSSFQEKRVSVNLYVSGNKPGSFPCILVIKRIPMVFSCFSYDEYKKSFSNSKIKELTTGNFGDNLLTNNKYKNSH